MKHRMRTIMLLLLTMLLLCPIQVLAAGGENAVKTDLEDGEYSIQVELEGGSGKAAGKDQPDGGKACCRTGCGHDDAWRRGQGNESGCSGGRRTGRCGVCA